MQRYCPLWCKSNFSFLEGASHPDELIEEAHHLGLRALALTDRDGLYGAVRAHVKARELGVRLLIGAQVTVAAEASPAASDTSHIVLLARDRAGYAQLCRLLTRGRRRCTKGLSIVSWDEVCSHSGGMIALWGGDGSLLARADAPGIDAVAGSLRDAFGDRLYGLLTRHRRAGELDREARAWERLERYAVAPLAATEVLYHTPARRPLQDVLACIRHGVPLASAGRRLRPNTEHALRSIHAFAELFRDLPDAVYRTAEVAERCSFSLDQIRYRYPAERLPDGSTTSTWLRELTLRGARVRYGDTVPQRVTRQVERELEVIDKLDYGGYFLTMWEIVEYCRDEGILCQGRGSAANSAVCYCLGITAIDPVRMNLLFERFLSEERAEPPDIDLDIANGRREEVIQHVYRKYGRDHAAMVANIIRYRSRSAIREVGKVLGIAETSLDRLAKLVSHNERVTPELLRRAGLDPEHRAHRHLAVLSDEILDFPRHLSIHPGGFLLGHEPVHDLVPIENASMAERTVIQWDKEDIEALGLFKVDLLGLGTLTQIDLCFQLLRTRGIELTMATIPPDDTATYDMICAGDTVGVFQIESRAQMAMLPRLRPRHYYDLVIEVSIVRPGPITGGMVHPYLRRRNGEERVEYPHESLRPVLEKTLGVPLFQEQVMKLAVVAADYTPGEADQLRRDMAAWRKTGRMEHHRDRLIRRMLAKGIEKEFAERVFKQICGFGEYGFPESHAASFALISYASAWLRCHYPAEFLCSILNAQPMGFYSAATLVEDGRRHSVQVLPVDVVKSRWDCAMEGSGEKTVVRLGLRQLKGLRKGDGERIEDARRRTPFAGLEDFVRRCGESLAAPGAHAAGTALNESAFALLAEAGAFAAFGIDRRQALWQVRALVHACRAPLMLVADEKSPAFRGLDPLETITWDYRATRLSVRGHPLAPLRSELSAQGFLSAEQLARMPHRRRTRACGIVICRQRPGTASGVTFMTLEDETGFVNVVIWKQVFQAHTVIIKTASVLAVAGRIQSEQGVVHLIADRLWEPELSGQRLSGGSRDFH